MLRTAAADPRVEVRLETSSWVEGRGVRHTDWSVCVGDAWVRIGELRDVVRAIAEPDVSFDGDVDELLVLPRGCQYRITYLPRLAVGTQLRKRISAPLESPRPRPRPAPQTQEEAVRRMLSAFPPLKPRLKTTVIEYRVGHRGTLMTEEQWQLRAERRRRPPARRATSGVSASEMEAFASKLREQLGGA